MENILLIATCLIGIITLIAVFILRPKTDTDQNLSPKMDELGKSILKIEQGLKEEFRLNREETGKASKDNREELNGSLNVLKQELSDTLTRIVELNSNNLKAVNTTLDEKLNLLAKNAKDQSTELRGELEKSLKAVQENFDKNVDSFNKLQKEKFELIEKKQTELNISTEKKLDLMRETVEEKLQKTLNERLSQSFETVGKQLQSVQEGLGEMRTLATDVGGLKRVLGGVKTRGGIGELQLSMLLRGNRHTWEVFLSVTRFECVWKPCLELKTWIKNQLTWRQSFQIHPFGGVSVEAPMFALGILQNHA